MALKTLKSKLPLLNTNRIKVLDAKAGATENIKKGAGLLALI